MEKTTVGADIVASSHHDATLRKNTVKQSGCEN